MPKRGLMIPHLDVDFVRDAYQVRRMIEYTAVPAMIAHLSDGEIAALQSRQDQLETALHAAPTAAATAELVDTIQREDWAMHQRFVACLGNQLLDNIYRVTAIKIRMAVQARLQVTNDNAQRVIQEHARILTALAARDAAATQQALCWHIDNSQSFALGLPRPAPQAPPAP